MAKKAPVNKKQLPLFSQETLSGPVGMVALNQLRAKALRCEGCDLAKTRNRVVFGEGPWDRPKIAFVGEAPEAMEDREGRPFVGPSGDLLIGALKSLGVSRDEVYICNTLCCRPPGNATPTGEQTKACKEFLAGQLRAVQPRAIVALGKPAAVALTGHTEAMGWLRGKWFAWEGIRVRVTWHPAYVLRRVRDGDGGQSRRELWSDLSAVMTDLGVSPPKRRPEPAIEYPVDTEVEYDPDADTDPDTNTPEDPSDDPFSP